MIILLLSLIDVQKLERSINLQLPVANLTHFLSVASNALFNMVQTPSADKNTIITIDEDDADEIVFSLSTQMISLRLSSSVFSLPDSVLEKIYTHEHNAVSLANHVAVKCDRSVDGKREYDLYYGDRLVREFCS